MLALGGWVLLLIVGVSYQVVPMFQLTPPYPKWLTASLAPALFAVLLAAGLLLDTPPRWAGLVADNLFWLFALLFSLATLVLQFQRKRRIPDATLQFFRIGMAPCCSWRCLPSQHRHSSIPSAKIMSGLIFLMVLRCR